jgi:DNA-directed RNA polymerase subunit RPC12/RpoP/nucleoid DNA-binding protein
MKKNTYHKSHLIRELGCVAGVSQKKIRAILDTLKSIACREAKNDGFTIPGLCRIDIIHRKARKVCNPRTREILFVGEHDSLRVRLLKRVRNEVTPPPEMMIQDARTITPDMEDFSKAISFLCIQCGQEIEAPLSTAGITAECPNCKATIVVPHVSEPGTLHGEPLPLTPEEEAEGKVNQVIADVQNQVEKQAHNMDQRGRTIRIDLAALGLEDRVEQKVPDKRAISFFCKNCRQEIEAMPEMAGATAECPACGVSFEVPFFSDDGTIHATEFGTDKYTAGKLKEMKSRTLRIEVPDDI